MKKTGFSLFIACVAGVSTLTAQTAALDLDGVDDFISTPVVMSSSTFTNITFECWVKSPAAPTQGNGHSGPMYSEFFGIVWNHQNVQFFGAASIGIASGTTSVFYSASYGPISPNTWYHLAAVYDGSVLTSYKNGAPYMATPVSGAIANSTVTLKLGRHPAFSNFFNGTIDAVRIWNRAFTCEEISANMNNEISSPQPGLIASYNFNNGVANGTNTSIVLVPDASGNNNAAALNNMALTGTTSNFVAQAPFNIPVQPTPSSISINPAQPSICNGQTITLSASGAAGFLWLPGYTEAPSITVSPVSSITYSLVGSNGTCIKTTTVTVNVGVCDGIETYDNSFIRFYPNPVKDLIHIELPQNMTAVTARMFDATGRLVKSVVLNGAEKTISVEKLERGIYQVQVLNGATVLSSKFIKE